MRILIISFIARQDGNRDEITRMIQESYKCNCTIFRFSTQQIHPCGGCRYECFGKEKPCPYIADPEYALLDAICNYDLTYFVIPNYCDYPCANYFIFNERSQCYFQHEPERLNVFLKAPKKFIVIGRISIRRDLLTSDAAVSEIRHFIANKENS